MRSPPRFQSNLARKLQKEEAPAAVPGLRYHVPPNRLARISLHREMTWRSRGDKVASRLNQLALSEEQRV
jgi:hypothetical protein